MTVWGDGYDGESSGNVVVIISDILYKRGHPPVRITAANLTDNLQDTIRFPVDSICIGWYDSKSALEDVGGGTVPARPTRRHPVVPERNDQPGQRVGSMKRARP
jgi:hypothetical protein